MHKRTWRLHFVWGRWLIKTYLNLQIVQLQTVTNIKKEEKPRDEMDLVRWSGKASLRN